MPVSAGLTAAQRRDRCITLIVGLEGHYVDHPKDPGGPTNWGVTIPALSAHRGRPCTAADIRALSVEEARAIYAEVYWPAVCGDRLPAGVDLVVADCAVNSGRGRAVQLLQQVLGVTVDRQLGPATLAAAAAADPVALVERLRLQRAAFYRSLPTFSTFGRGWLNRLSTVALTASAWARRA